MRRSGRAAKWHGFAPLFTPWAAQSAFNNGFSLDPLLPTLLS